MNLKPESQRTSFTALALLRKAWPQQERTTVNAMHKPKTRKEVNT